MTRKENDGPDIATRDELLIGELTAALAAESMSELDALPPAFAARAIAARAASAGEVIVAHAPMAPASRPRRSYAMWGGWLAAAAMLALWVRGPANPSAVVAAAPSAVASSADASSAAASFPSPMDARFSMYSSAVFRTSFQRGSHWSS